MELVKHDHAKSQLSNIDLLEQVQDLDKLCKKEAAICVCVTMCTFHVQVRQRSSPHYHWIGIVYVHLTVISLYPLQNRLVALVW